MYGPSRRQTIQAGLAGLAGLSLPDLLRLRAAGDSARDDTAVIYVLQEGGASQFETWDPKPDAGTEIRGEFATTKTAVPGLQFSELMAEQARIADKLVVLRSIHHPSTQHSSSVHLIKTGFYCAPANNDNEMPSVGSYVAKVRGAVAPKVPPYVLLYHGERYDGPNFLGPGYAPLTVKSDEDRPALRPPNLALTAGVTGEQMRDRAALLNTFERERRILDTKNQAVALDEFQRQAVELVTGPAARKAFDLDAEPMKLRERYGRDYLGDRFLLARRLVEHGVRFVTVGTFGWDHHGDLWKDMRRNAPRFDRALAALVSDLFDRGLAERVLVVVMGEFGRTPQISAINNLPPGRDHWGDVMSVLLAGGGFDGGRAVGSSDRKGAVPTSSLYRLECVLALMYRHLGIDPAVTFTDPSGRPRSLLDIRDRIKELEA
jgi:hypothetical protein